MQDLQKEFVKDSKALVKSMGLEEGDIKVSEYMQYSHSMIAYKFADAMIKERNNTTMNNFDRTKMTKKDNGKWREFEERNWKVKKA